MKALINKIKSWFKPKKKNYQEKYIINETYKEADFVKEFLDRRLFSSKLNGYRFTLTYAPLNPDVIGYVHLIYGEEKVDSATLKRAPNTNMVAWKFE